MSEPGQPTPPAFDLPCGGRAVFDRSSGISHRCSDCFAVVGSMGMPNQCREGSAAMSLSALLERVEGATAQDQWQVIRDIALALVPDDPSTRIRINALGARAASLVTTWPLFGRRRSDD